MHKNYLKLLITAYSFSTFSQGILGPIYAFYVQKIGGGILETSYALAIFSIVTGLVTLLIYNTKTSEKYHVEFLCIGWLLWLISVIMYFFVKNVLMLFLTESLSALGSALSNPAYDAEYSKQITHNVAKGWALQEGITTIFYGLACLTGGFIANSFGFPILMLLMTFLSTISFLLILYYVFETKSKKISS